MASINCFQRIQKYLETDTKSDHRLKIRESSQDPRTEPDQGTHGIYGSDIELQGFKQQPEIAYQDLSEQDAIVIRNGTFGWKVDDEPILKDISIAIGVSQLTMIIGTVASGKSTLLKALLGETPSTEGFVYVSSTEIAFCDQTPWLRNGSVQKNILGFSLFNGPWYNSVIHACGLEEDLATFPSGDQSQIGSKGITLSGGQKQRVVGLF